MTQVVDSGNRGKVDVFVSAEFACSSIKGVSQDSRQMTMLQIIRVKRPDFLRFLANDNITREGGKGGGKRQLPDFLRLQHGIARKT